MRRSKTSRLSLHMSQKNNATNKPRRKHNVKVRDFAERPMNLGDYGFNTVVAIAKAMAEREA